MKEIATKYMDVYIYINNRTKGVAFFPYYSRPAIIESKRIKLMVAIRLASTLI